MLTDPRFETYYHMLVSWNERMNLTAITEREAVYKKHFEDSLAALDYIPKGARVIDVGTGAGFPAVPIMLMRPDIQVTLVDGLQKRIGFLCELLHELDLTAQCIHARAEDIGRDKRYRGSFDIALSRAVAALPVLLEYTVPLLKVGGVSICYKGDAGEELGSASNAAHKLNAALTSVDVNADWGKRCLIFAKKTAPTPNIYPRKAGTPQKFPL